MMRTLRKLALAGVAGSALLGLAAGPAGAATAHPAAPPAHTASTDPAASLRAARITFFTADDDKDFDTVLTVLVRDPAGRNAAIACCNTGRFPDHSTSDPILLSVNPGFTAGSLNNGSVEVAIAPVGHDTWRFSFRADLDFSDGTSVPVLGDDLTLSQDHPTLFVPMTTVGLVAVPNLLFDTTEEANAELVAVGLVLGSVDSGIDRPCSFEDGEVMSQRPRAGTPPVPTGTAVDITLAVEPKVCP
jgi:hypothetical protein